MKDLYQLARRRVIRKKRFFQHLTFFIPVILFVFLLNTVLFITTWWTYDPNKNSTQLIQDILAYPYWWFQYPLLGWGLLLLIHYFTAFGIPLIGHYDEKWEALAIEEEVKRLRSKGHLPRTSDDPPLELKNLQKQANSHYQKRKLDSL